MSIKNIILRISLIILVVEILIMLLLNFIPYKMSNMEEAFVDAFLLVIFASPIIYLYVIEPFIIMKNEAMKKVTYLAYHDKLTSLPNLDKFMEWIEHSIESSNNNTAIFVLDIGSLKVLHESLGLDAINEIILQLVSRLKKLVSNKNVLARIGPNKFSFILEGIESNDELYAFAKSILESLKEPIIYGEHKILLDGSIGISRYLKDAKNHTDMLKYAHTAMRKAQSFEDDKISFYAQALTEVIHATFSLEEDMRVALEENQFFLLYQPKIDAKTNTMVGVEALIRWKHPKKGLLSPVDFIPIAEESGLIIPIGEWVLCTALKTLESLMDTGKELIVMSINLSGRQITSKEIENIIGLLKKSRVPMKYIDFEITETYLMKDVSQSQILLEKLHDLGVSLSMDDFGTGYSSLAYLKKFQVDILKIDRMLIKDIQDNPNDFVIAKAIVVMGHALGLKIVAEGVETQGQIQMLQEIDCDYFQGFYFSKPVKSEVLFS